MLCGFNPRSHTGSDIDRICPGNGREHVSIHAPTQGATENYIPAGMIGEQFQSTLPHRERPRPPYSCSRYFPVSIHAPTQGATESNTHYECSIIGFNPRSHTGSDSASKFVSDNKIVSIHAPTQGATIHTKPGGSLTHGFNPRSHTGSDFRTIVSFLGQPRVSIHAPTQGATTYKAGRELNTRFQSTLPHRERLYHAVTRGC